MKRQLIIGLLSVCVMADALASQVGFLRSLVAQSVNVFTWRSVDFQNALLVPLMYTRKSIKGLAYTLSNKHIIDALLQKAGEGVSVELVVDASVFSTLRRHVEHSSMVLDEVRGLNKGLLKLIEHERVNVHVYNGEGAGLMHCKSFILEGVEVEKKLYNLVHSGSANCTHAGLNGTNCEVSHLFNGKDVYDEYVKLFDEIKNSSKMITVSSSRNGHIFSKNRKRKQQEMVKDSEEMVEKEPEVTENPRTVTIQRVGYASISNRQIHNGKRSKK